VIVVALAATLHSLGVGAVDFRRVDGVHRLEKKAQITSPAKLQLRKVDGQGACAESLTLCPLSDGGGCCPDGYQCARESCYATTKGPSTCGTKVGWHACEAANGGGCCPDGLLCGRGNCVPPPGSSYAYSCPASHYLCPASMNFGCCPNGMGCAPNQCYSTGAKTITTTMVVTTTQDGDETTITTTATSVRTPRIPTAIPTADDAQDVLKFFPSSVPKVEIEPAKEDKDKDDDGSLSKGAVGGIVAGAVVFLIIILGLAWLILRRLKQVSEYAGSSKPPTASGGRKSQMRQTPYQPTESEMDGNGVVAGTVSPPASLNRPFRRGQPTPDQSVHSQAASSFAGPYQPVSPSDDAQPIYDMSGNIAGYFNNPSMKAKRNASITVRSMARLSEDSQTGGAYSHHGRQWSNASETSDQDARPGLGLGLRGPTPPGELEGDQRVPAELVGSPIVSPLDEGATFAAIPGFYSTTTTTTRKRNNSGGSGNNGYYGMPPIETSAGPSNYLEAVDEESNSYQSRTFRIMGQPMYQPVNQGLPDDQGEYRDYDDGNKNKGKGEK
jgi:hypothetical protein